LSRNVRMGSSGYMCSPFGLGDLSPEIIILCGGIVNNFLSGFAPGARSAFRAAALSEGGERIGIEAHFLAQFPRQRAHVRPVRFLETPFGVQNTSLRTCSGAQLLLECACGAAGLREFY
jgi:hypothetical protein